MAFKDKLAYLKNNRKLISRLIKNYVLILIKNKKRLRTVELALTYNCQCNCEHCYAKSIKKKRKKLSLKGLKKVIEDCVDLGAIHFLLTGGEPLLYEGFSDLCKFISSRGTILTIATNALLLNKKRIKKIKEAGVDFIEISLDYPDKRHDKFRNRAGCFENAIKSLEICKEEGVLAGINAVVTNEKIIDGTILDIIKLAKKMRVPMGLCFPTNNGGWLNKNVILNKENWKKALALIKKHNINICENNNYIKNGCFAGQEKINVNIYGDVMPCPYIQMVYGNVFKEDLRNIYENMSKDPSLNKFDNSFCLPAYNRKFIECYRKLKS